jgi:hypothetical protein
MEENEMKSLESRLRSWQPRRPSATLKWRLFLAHAAGVPRMLKFAGWLTPATVCVLLAIVSLNSGNAVSTGGFPVLSLSTMMSNQSYAVYATSRQSEQNNLSVFTFDWTNRNGSGSPIGFPQFRKPIN